MPERIPEDSSPTFIINVTVKISTTTTTTTSEPDSHHDPPTPNPPQPPPNPPPSIPHHPTPPPISSPPFNSAVHYYNPYPHPLHPFIPFNKPIPDHITPGVFIVPHQPQH